MDTHTEASEPLARRRDADPGGEASLIAQIAGGDRRAFETLYRAYLPRLTRFLHRMTRNVPLIEEIVDDTMLVVWQKASTFDHSCKLSTWVFAIAYRKGCKVLHRLDEPVDADMETCEGEADWRPEWRCEQARLAQALDAALDELPLAQRAAFQLTFYHDMSYAEIAEILECPVNTVKTRLFHARRRLALLLADQLEGRP
ncbi:sigma-70 family RNA polymerase sigma factor [Massilia terrae]|uniref:Sigma-70 family RNA polymerase sigma factor n=1 Tax=Massilia terrae TaxID=1811224 RepID=A0ABT2D096_9BURK|nr:sigma-70 family RNA polymerase sigma factor [Massilia terrae]